jgi:hypothetical protein
MSDLKHFAEQLVDLTVKEVVELSKILVDEYGCDVESNYVFHNYESKPEFFVPRTENFVFKNDCFFDKNKKFMLFSKRKII